jgi:hypothetical protein
MVRNNSKQKVPRLKVLKQLKVKQQNRQLNKHKQRPRLLKAENNKLKLLLNQSSQLLQHHHLKLQPN